mgnify:CR=1 FL=1
MLIEDCGFDCGFMLNKSAIRNPQSAITMSSIVAAVMPAPRVPVELREFAEPALEPGSGPAPHAVLRSLRHRRSRLARAAARRAVSDHPGSRVGRRRRTRFAATCAASTARRVAEGDRLVFFDVHRTCGRCRACTVTRTPTRCAARRVYGITDSADEGLFGGWAEAIYLEPGVAIAHAARLGAGGNLHQRRLRTDHRGARHRPRGDLTLGDTVLVQGTGAVGLSVIALARLAGATRVIALRRAGRSPRARARAWAPTSSSTFSRTGRRRAACR